MITTKPNMSEASDTHRNFLNNIDLLIAQMAEGETYKLYRSLILFNTKKHICTLCP
jgi:hypothetical protein